MRQGGCIKQHVSALRAERLFWHRVIINYTGKIYVPDLSPRFGRCLNTGKGF
jgi:hypothetical protein